MIWLGVRAGLGKVVKLKIWSLVTVPPTNSIVVPSILDISIVVPGSAIYDLNISFIKTPMASMLYSQLLEKICMFPLSH